MLFTLSRCLKSLTVRKRITRFSMERMNTAADARARLVISAWLFSILDPKSINRDQASNCTESVPIILSQQGPQINDLWRIMLAYLHAYDAIPSAPRIHRCNIHLVMPTDCSMLRRPELSRRRWTCTRRSRHHNQPKRLSPMLSWRG